MLLALRQAQDDESRAHDDESRAHDDESRAQDDESRAQDDESRAQFDHTRHGELVEPCTEQHELVRDVRLFHARVIEAVDAAVERIVADIAADVLARELLLAPADIDAIVDRALRRFAAEEPLRVRVHPDDAARLHCGVPVIGDPSLRCADAILELREGSVDASLGVRLAALVRAAQ